MDAPDLELVVEDLYRRAGATDGDVWLPSRLARVLLGRPVLTVPNLKAYASLSRVQDRDVIAVRRTLPSAIAEWAIGHELAHWAGVVDEREANYVGAAILLRRRPFLRALYATEGDWAELAETFGTTSTSAVLRAGELEGRPLAVVTPARVYARGNAAWPDEGTLRRWARQGRPGVRRAKLRDDPRRVVLEGVEGEAG